MITIKSSVWSIVLISIFTLHLPNSAFGHGGSIKKASNTTTTTKRPPNLLDGSTIVKFVELLTFDETQREAQLILEISRGSTTPGTEAVEAGLLIQNAKSYETISSTNISITEDVGGISTKVKVTIPCKMIYLLYPFDSHLCTVAMGKSPGVKGTGEIFPVFSSGTKLEAFQFRVKGYLEVPLATGPVVYFWVERTSAMRIVNQMYTPVIMLVSLSFFTMLSAIPFSIRIGSSLGILLCVLVITSIFWQDVPRGEQGEVTVLEHYFAIGVGFIFQAFFTNILMYWYSCLAKRNMMNNDGNNYPNGDLEMSTTARPVKPTQKPGQTDTELESEQETFIRKLGGCHRFMYFKCLKPAKKHLPFFFFLINFIYWPLVICLASGLPKGFEALPTTDPATIATAIETVNSTQQISQM